MVGLASNKMAECEVEEEEGEGLRDREEAVECDASEHVEGRRESDGSDMLEPATMNSRVSSASEGSSMSCACDPSARASDANVAAFTHDNQDQVTRSDTKELTTRVVLKTFWSTVTRPSSGGPKASRKRGGANFAPVRVS